MNKNKTSQGFHFKHIRWVYVAGIIIVIGGVMSFGLAMLPLFNGQLTSDDAVYMLGMIIPMSILSLIILWLIVRRLEKKLEPLITGIHEVTEGNLDVELSTENAAEYADVYSDFNLMVTELKQTKEEMQNFVNEFTHEFKTPITSISGFADYLYESGDEISSEERSEYLKIISEQAGRLSRLAQNTLLLSKVEACQIITETERFSLSGQLERVALLFLKQLDEKNITLNIPEDAEIWFYGNEEMLEQVWINLLGNAVKFTPEGCEISIEETESPQEIRVCIRDTGVGISSETIEHIFDKYYQNDGTSSVKGNGIGLSIVKRIVELSGGEISVESEPGEGSSFTVVLPKTK